MPFDTEAKRFLADVAFAPQEAQLGNGGVGGSPGCSAVRALGLVPSADTVPAAVAASALGYLDMGPGGVGGVRRLCCEVRCQVLGSAGSSREGSPCEGQQSLRAP